MHRTRAAGILLLAAGTIGYVVGVIAPYPGRAFTLTAVMVGLTLAAIGGESS